MLKLKRISLISIGISATLATLLVLVDAVQFVLTVVTKVIKLYIQGRATSFAIAETRDDARAWRYLKMKAGSKMMLVK